MNPVNAVGISRNVYAYHKGYQGKASKTSIPSSD